MLDRIKVKGFQSLRDVDISLGRFTVILGESGCGKSAFIRSVLKLSRNDAVGGTSSGEDWSHLPPKVANAEVTLDVDGHTVKWVKGKSNSYVIDGEPLHKVGRGCPDEVQDVLKMRELTFEGTDSYHLNFAQQFDMPFLLDDSGSKVAKILGEITNVNVLYAANRQANSLKTTASKTLSVRAQDLERQQELLQQYAYLPQERVNLATVLQLQGVVEEDVESFKELCAYASKVGRLQEAVQECGERLETLKQLPVAETQVRGVFADLGLYEKLQDYGMSLGTGRVDATNLLAAAKLLAPVYKTDVEGLENELAQYRAMLGYEQSLGSREKHLAFLERESKVTAPVAAVNVKELAVVLATYQEMSSTLDGFTTQAGITVRAAIAMREAQDELAEAQESYNSFVVDNPICPLCGNMLPCADSEEAIA